MSQAQVQAPAPDFTATALVDGDFEQVSLSKYRGMYQYHRSPSFRSSAILTSECFMFRSVRRTVFLPVGFHVCLPNWDHRIQWSRSRVQKHWVWSSCLLDRFRVLTSCMVRLEIICSIVISQSHSMPIFEINSWGYRSSIQLNNISIL